MFRKIGAAFRRMMYGRYGSDELNLLLLILAVLISLCNAVLSSIFTQSEVFVRWISPSLSLLMLGLLGVNLYRCFSRNIYKRQQENAWYLRKKDAVTRWFRSVKDRWQQRKDYRFFRCPKCHALLRVPKGKGKIQLTCRKCGNRFERKS